MNRLTESKIVEKLIYDSYKKDLHYAIEVPFYRNKIDLVTINPRNKEVIAIEAKISNWYRAIQQATSYTLCADKVYLAIWHEYAHRVDENLLEKYGIGLMSVNGTVEILHKSKKSRDFNNKLIQRMRNFVLNNN